MICTTVVCLLFSAINKTLFPLSSFTLSISLLSPHSSSKNDRRMKIRKCLHKVIVPPNTVKQGLGVVLSRLMTTNFNLLCLNTSLPQGAGTSTVSLTSTNHVNTPFFSTNLTHGIAHVSRVHHNTVTFMLE
jgi:hypothetical protein